MNFKSITIDDKEILNNYLKSANLKITEHCFTTIFMWQDYFCTQYYEDGNFLYLKSKSMPDGHEHFICPIGKGNLKTALDTLYETFGMDIDVVSVTEEQKQILTELYSGELHFSELRDSADYIYLSEKLISLSGKKLQAKRNFVNRFLKEYGELGRLESITNENKHKAWEFQQEWSKQSQNEEELESLKAEMDAIKRIIDNYEALGVIGALLYVGDTVIGYTLSTKSTEEVAIIHIEKCNTEYIGAYQMINKAFAEMHLSDVTYINREEDMGIEGLRKAKLSYKPEILCMKYLVTRK